MAASRQRTGSSSSRSAALVKSRVRLSSELFGENGNSMSFNSNLLTAFIISHCKHDFLTKATLPLTPQSRFREAESSENRLAFWPVSLTIEKGRLPQPPK